MEESFKEYKFWKNKKKLKFLMPYILFRGGCLEFRIVNFKSQFI